ncbi:hypothetical protein K438DRAFT_1995019 [Mycena galopus ATCC 62051]|nr:hypothetical protein K438DRAFT_1995019 [Mycena galopus ATCC 62051]
MDAHDLHARRSMPPNMPPAAALFSISSSSTSSFARWRLTRIAGGVLWRPSPISGPCTTSSSTSSSIITARDRDVHQAQYYSTSIATLRTKACPKRKPSTTSTPTRSLSSSTTAPSVLLGGSAAHAGQGHTLRWK